MGKDTRIVMVRLLDTITSLVSVPMVDGFEAGKTKTFNEMGFKHQLDYIKSYPGLLKADSDVTNKMCGYSVKPWEVFELYVKTDPFMCSEIVLWAKDGGIMPENCMIFPTEGEMKKSYEYEQAAGQTIRDRMMYFCTDWSGDQK